MSRVACETVATKNMVMVTGEITTQSDLNFDEIARGVMRQIGYTDVSYGIDGNSCGVIAHVSQQSPDISSGVTTSLEERGSAASDARRATGAGDQGMMVGFACDETDGLMPITVDLSHRLVEQWPPSARTAFLITWGRTASRRSRWNTAKGSRAAWMRWSSAPSIRTATTVSRSPTRSAATFLSTSSAHRPGGTVG